MYSDMFRILLSTFLILSASRRAFSIVISGSHNPTNENILERPPASGEVSTTQFGANAPPLPKCCPQGQRLNERMEQCEMETPRVIAPLLSLEWQDRNNGIQPQVSCAPGNTLRLPADNATRRAHPLANGSLVLDIAPDRQVTLQRDEFCVEEVGTSEAGGSPWALLVCPCEYEICVRKCCPPRQILLVHEIAEGNVFVDCIDAEEGEQTWQPVFKDASPPHEVLLAAWPAGCEEGVVRVPPRWAKPIPGVRTLALQSNGSVIVNYKPPMLIEGFCLDFERDRHGVLNESIVHCAEPLEAPFIDMVMSGVSMVGGVALLLVLITYALLPELRISAFGRALVCYATSLLMSKVLDIAWTMAPAISNVRCVITMLWKQFFLISAAFWLNVMCLDMGLAFSLFQCSWTRGSSADRRFIRYSMYAWGGPSVISVVTLAMQLALPSGHPCRPIEWFMGCKYFTPTAQFAFFYAPMVVLLVSNLILLIYVAWCIRKLLKSRRILEVSTDSSVVCPYTGKKKLLMFTRLFWAVGVLEMGIEIIAWAGASFFTYWNVTNVVDLSRALCLFALVCCKRRVLKRVRERVQSLLTSSANQRFLNRAVPRASGVAISSSALSTTRNTSHATDSSTRSTGANSSVRMMDIELRDMKSNNGGHKMPNHEDVRKIAGKTVAIPVSGTAHVDSLSRPRADITMYDVTIRENPSSQRSENTIMLERNVKSSAQTVSFDEKIDDSSLELGDLSNSASNSPLTKSFPSESTSSSLEKQNVESFSGKQVRTFRRRSSKVMVNPTFEPLSEPNKTASKIVQEGGTQVPELSVVDDNVLLNSTANEYPIDVPRNRGAVSVTSL